MARRVTPTDAAGSHRDTVGWACVVATGSTGAGRSEE